VVYFGKLVFESNEQVFSLKGVKDKKISSHQKKDLLRSVLKVRICLSQSRVGGRGGSMVSGALGNIFRLCPHMFLLCRFALFLLSPPFFGASSLGALGSCPSRLPFDPPLVGGKRNRAECHLHKVSCQGKRERSEY